MHNLKRNCPICLCKTGQILHHQLFILPKGNPLPKQYDVVCCDKCGFVFADTPKSQNVYNSYYECLSKYEDKKVATGNGVSSLDQLRLSNTAKDIARTIKNKDISILDIGCASGGLLLELSKLDFHDLYGSDPSSACVSDFQKHGIKIEKRGLFTNNDVTGKKYDLVILTHVFEHLKDLRNAVKNISGLVKDDGSLYIEVPDASRYSGFYIIPYYYIDSEHINHFDEESLKNLFERFGYGLISVIKKEIKVSSNQICPAVGVFFEKTSNKDRVSKITKTTTVQKSFLEFLKKSKEDSSFGQIDDLVKEQKEIFVWGVGSLTQRLLSTTNLGQCKIMAFVDNDSKKVGTTILGKKIYSPEILKKYNFPILICAAVKNEEIESQIKYIDPKREIINLKK